MPTCQVLPPNFPGYEPYCPYTTNPGSGKWTAPDLAKAKQLIDASGTKGAAVKVNTDSTDDRQGLGLYFVGLLNKLGYKATLQALSPDIQYPYIQNSKNKRAVRVLELVPGLPGGVGLPQHPARVRLVPPEQRTRARTSPQFCNKAIQAKMDQAGQIGHHRPGRRRTRSGPQVDKEVTDQAPWVAMFNPKYIDFALERASRATCSARSGTSSWTRPRCK